MNIRIAVMCLLAIMIAGCRSNTDISVGSSFQEANTMLSSRGYSQPSNMVELQENWLNPVAFWISPNNTAVLLNANYPDGGITQITVGESGKGITSMEQWRKQHVQDVDAYELE